MWCTFQTLAKILKENKQTKIVQKAKFVRTCYIKKENMWKPKLLNLNGNKPIILKPIQSIILIVVLKRKIIIFLKYN